MPGGGVYVRDINLIYRNNEIIASRYNWRYNFYGNKAVFNRDTDPQYTIIGQDFK